MSEPNAAPAPAAPTTPAPAAAPAPAPATPPPTQQDAGRQGPWWESADLQLDKEAQVFIAGKNPKDIGALVGMTRDFERMSRERNVWEKPDPNRLAEWPHHKDLGWEPDAAKYQLKKPPAAGKAQAYDQGLHDVVAKTAHQARVPVAAAQAILDAGFAHMADYAEKFDREQTRQRNELTDALKAEWGNAYPERLEKARRAMRAFGVSLEESNELEAAMGSPNMVRLFDRMGGLIGEDKLVLAGSPDARAGQSPTQAEAEQRMLMADEAFMASMRDPQHPLHEANKAKWAKLSAAKVARGGV